MATVSFAEESYRVSEGTGTLVINITRSGDTDIAATVLVATDNFEGTASGMQACNYVQNFLIIAKLMEVMVAAQYIGTGECLVIIIGMLKLVIFLWQHVFYIMIMCCGDSVY